MEDPIAIRKQRSYKTLKRYLTRASVLYKTFESIFRENTEQESKDSALDAMIECIVVISKIFMAINKLEQEVHNFPQGLDEEVEIIADMMYELWFKFGHLSPSYIRLLQARSSLIRGQNALLRRQTAAIEIHTAAVQRQLDDIFQEI